MFGLAPLVKHRTSGDSIPFLVVVSIISSSYGAAKVLIAPLVAEYFGPENANTGMNTI
jgi:hypothetical protein